MLPLPFPTIINGKNGAISFSRHRDQIKGCVLVPPDASVPVVVPVRSGTGNGQSAAIIIESPSDAWVEVFSLIGLNGASVNADVIARQCVSISTYINGQRRHMKFPINVTHVFGTNLNPCFLDDPYSEPLILPPQSIIRMVFTNPSTAGETDFSFSLGARKIMLKAIAEDPRLKSELDALYKRRQKIYPMWMPLGSQPGSTPLGVPGVTIPAAGYANVFFEADNIFTGEFVITRIMASALTEGTPATDMFELTLFDAKTDRVLTNQPVIATCLGGTAAFPMNLPTPIIVGQNMNIRAQFKNLVANGTTDVFCSLQGFGVEK